MSKDQKVVDFVAKRNQNIESKKRQFERVALSNFLGCYSVVDDNGSIYQVSLVDISADGCMIQIPFSKNAEKIFKTDSDITLRLYFTKDSYITTVMKVRYSKPYIEKGQEFYRCGGQFDQSLPSYAALKSFTEFITKFAEHSCIDRGDAKVLFI
jgi:hypothetical protein